MLVKVLTAVATLAVPGGAAVAQVAAGAADEPPVVVAQGQGRASAPADYAKLTGQAHGEGADPQSALKAAAASRDAIGAGLQRLEGARSMRIEAGSLQVTPVRTNTSGCGYAPVPPTSGPCAPASYVATVELTAEVRPASRIGAAASLAVQLGLGNPRLESSDVDAPSTLAAEAARRAFADAQVRAQALAAGAGGRLGRVLRVEPAGGYQVIVTGSRYAANAPPPPPPPMLPPITPDVTLALTPPEATANAEVRVTFQLLP